MKRNKTFWANLSPEQRSRLVYLEKAGSNYSSKAGGYLPDGCGECPACFEPTTAIKLCASCQSELQSLITAATPNPVNP